MLVFAHGDAWPIRDGWNERVREWLRDYPLVAGDALGLRLPRAVRRRAWDLALTGSRRASRAQLPDPIVARLRDALAPDAERLRELTGVEKPGWSV